MTCTRPCPTELIRLFRTLSSFIREPSLHFNSESLELSTLPATIVIAPINVESRKQFIDELKEKNLPFPEIDDEEFWTISLQNKFLQYVEYIQQEQIADSLLEDSTFSEDEKETHLSDWLRLYQNILAQTTESKPDFIIKDFIYEVKSNTNLTEFIDSKAVYRNNLKKELLIT